ncbi:FecCD family ABC transporter permease [Nesterenkonia xinjiangensis]|uniref:Iron complex transport system permease protein n=1 Tax=Nesterenkonia xinjiangensis TaxID=225327 RepID=A0A7Z0GJS5_9MICC|nr:iron complex transport system permease protein [Nesterenkonia xinjiangensis]
MSITPGPRNMLLRIGGARVVAARRALTTTAILCAASGLLLIGSLAWGDYPLSVTELLHAFAGQEDGLTRTIVMEWRLPRALAALAFGAALAVSGAIFQTLTRNPLASPDIIGLSHGSFTGMLVVLVVLGGSWTGQLAGALLGGLAAAAIIHLLAWRGGLQGFRLIVVGIGVSSMLASTNTWLLLTADLDTAMAASAWGAGTLSRLPLHALPAALALTLMLLGLGLLGVPALRQLSLGDDVARSTGLRVERARLLLIGVAVALIAVVTTMCGPISFVALAAPQIARRLAGTAEIPLTTTAACGALLLLSSDAVAQHVLPMTIPAGVVTVALGGAYLIWLLIHEIRRTP